MRCCCRYALVCVACFFEHTKSQGSSGNVWWNTRAPVANYPTVSNCFLGPLRCSIYHVCCLRVQMQRWIDQSRTKMFDIVAQTNEDVLNLELRVAYVG